MYVRFIKLSGFDNRSVIVRTDQIAAVEEVSNGLTCVRHVMLLNGQVVVATNSIDTIWGRLGYGHIEV